MDYVYTHSTHPISVLTRAGIGFYFFREHKCILINSEEEKCNDFLNYYGMKLMQYLNLLILQIPK